MLSILIPIYNFDVRQLVGELKRQCSMTGLPFEILCYDDGSAQPYKTANKDVMAFPCVVYKELPQNLGRSAIRNIMGKKARFKYLLLMDCDAKVTGGDFIGNYLEHARPGSLVYGGRCYSPIPPDDSSLMLHWLYGKRREEKPAPARQGAPWHSFMTNNFLIPKDIFLSIGFDESLTQYGHEDTIFGQELKKHKIPIIHINNPLEHIGLETAAVFLTKTKLALQNLKFLMEKNADIETTLLKVYRKIKNWGLSNFVVWGFKVAEPFIERQLKSKTPNLLLFDFYKLGYFTSLNRR